MTTWLWKIIVPELHIVNDAAERGVALMQELNAFLTKHDEQTQGAIQVIKEHRYCYPDFQRRNALVTGLGPVGSPK